MNFDWYFTELCSPVSNISSLFQITACRLVGAKPLSEPMMIRLLAHICFARPQCVKSCLILCKLCAYRGLRICASHDMNTLRPRQIRCHFADDIFSNENHRILNKASLKYGSYGPTNIMPVFPQIMVCRRIGEKPLSDPMVIQFTVEYMRHPDWWDNSMLCCLQYETSEMYAKRRRMRHVWVITFHIVQLCVIPYTDHGCLPLIHIITSAVEISAYALSIFLKSRFINLC